MRPGYVLNTKDDAVDPMIGAAQVRLDAASRLGRGRQSPPCAHARVDSETTKRLTEGTLKQSGQVLRNAPKAQIEKFTKTISFASGDRVELVENGMTRALRRQNLYRSEVMGGHFSKRTRSRVTVEPAP